MLLFEQARQLSADPAVLYRVGERPDDGPGCFLVWVVDDQGVPVEIEDDDSSAFAGLLKKGLLSQELAFETFLDGPPWKKIEAAALSLRAERGEPAELENLEYAYHRLVDWKARAPQQSGQPAPN